MTTVPVQPFILRDVDFTVALEGDVTPDNYEFHVSRVALTPSTSVVTWQGLSPDASFSAQTSSTWVAELTGAQDWETANSLSGFLFDHEGERASITFQPRKGSSDTFTVDVTLAPASVGGDVNTVPVFSVSLGCDGKPVRTPAA